MEKYLCQECNQYIFCHVKDRHELYCLNSIKENEYNNLIPCELCSEFIEFDSLLRSGVQPNSEVISKMVEMGTRIQKECQ